MVFANTFTKNRHVSKLHPEEETTRKKHIKCPICPNEENFSFHDCLIKHLSAIHNLNIQQSVFILEILKSLQLGCRWIIKKETMLVMIDKNMLVEKRLYYITVTEAILKDLLVHAANVI